MATAPTKYFTYAPGKAPANLSHQEIKLSPGQALGFAPGLGYYAKAAAAGPLAPVPSVRPPAPPPVAGALTPNQIDMQAGLIAQSGLTPQQDEIRRQQQLASQQASANEDKITGLSKATAEMLAGLAPADQQAYMDASKEEGQLGQGLATGVQNDVAAKVAADQAFMESQGQSGGSTLDPAALHDTLFELNGNIPASQFAEEGAHAAQWDNAQPEIALNAGRAELAQAMATAQQNNDQYAQQLIQLAATYPGLKAQALQQLNQYELDKANYRLSATKTTADIASQKRQDALAARSERAQEKAAGIDAANKTAEINYKWASLNFQTKKAQQAAQTAAARIAASGRKVNASASKELGYLVDNDAQPILDGAGNRIPVKTGAATVDKTKVATDAATKAASYLVRATKIDANTQSAAMSSAQAQQGLYQLVYAELHAIGWSDKKIAQWVASRVKTAYTGSKTKAGVVLPPAK